MAYDINDSNGFVAGGPSIGGLADLREELTARNAASLYPQLSMFLDKGYASNPSKLKFECQALSTLVKRTTVKQTLVELGLAANKAKDIVILHNHLS